MSGVLVAQKRPSTTNAETFIDPAKGIHAVEVNELMIVNTHSSTVVVTVYLDADGTAWDTTNELLEKSIAADDYLQLTFRKGIQVPQAGSMGIKAATVDVIVFSAFGRDIENVALRGS